MRMRVYFLSPSIYRNENRNRTPSIPGSANGIFASIASLAVLSANNPIVSTLSFSHAVRNALRRETIACSVAVQMLKHGLSIESDVNIDRHGLPKILELSPQTSTLIS
jgi:hypothetical protein